MNQWTPIQNIYYPSKKHTHEKNRKVKAVSTIMENSNGALTRVGEIRRAAAARALPSNEE